MGEEEVRGCCKKRRLPHSFNGVQSQGAEVVTCSQHPPTSDVLAMGIPHMIANPASELHAECPTAKKKTLLASCVSKESCLGLRNSLPM